ncbi:hypothetical protein [Parapedobacter soli]|uniref:hypothetical protein n=1 Tax=Parapedobacter soli TaxID=416955 RepID=UPI0021C73E53|nr:hypothetical protein [Parapedobacter soli]
MATYTKQGKYRYLIEMDESDVYYLHALFSELYIRGSSEPEEIDNLKRMFDAACKESPHMTKQYADTLDSIHRNMYVAAFSRETIREMNTLFDDIFEKHIR